MSFSIRLRLFLLVAVSFSLFACASRDKNPYGNPCRAMEVEAREMEALDAELAKMDTEIKALERAGDAGDAGGVAALQQRVTRLREQRRALQHSLERNAAECLPMIHDVPPRDPVRRVE
jgi:hypothetical protein